MKKRNINIDFVKCLAVFFVISVHFFLNNGFYDKIIEGRTMYVFIIMRSLFMICVPLFLVTTGYLMKNKKLEKEYYIKINKTLSIYIISTIMIIIYQIVYLKYHLSLKTIIREILEFDIGYCWYIKMYIGLYILIPFINLIYNNLKTKKEKKILIISMMILTSFPGITNIKYHLLPDWWLELYPLTYYFWGAYLKEYKLNMSKLTNLIAILVSLTISSVINIYLSNESIFNRGIHNDWGSIFNVLTTILIFNLILNINLEKVHIIIKKTIIKISELSLGLYLISNMVDNYLYVHYFKNNNIFNVLGYFKVIPLVFIISLVLSFIIDIIYKIFKRIANLILNKYKEYRNGKEKYVI